ncbi:hypothetical protein HK28_11270 [Acetobacter sp. DsW_063]|nr:hypothetical protein HK28_11270 [Acetobacter sp. DsW_063]
MLCCAFNDAPGADPMKLMKRIVGLGSDAIEQHRIVLLVLPQGNQAMKVIDDSGELPESVEHGYTIRASQVEDSLTPSSPLSMARSSSGRTLTRAMGGARAIGTTSRIWSRAGSKARRRSTRPANVSSRQSRQHNQGRLRWVGFSVSSFHADQRSTHSIWHIGSDS